MRLLISSLVFALMSLRGVAQASFPPDPAHREWHAGWVTHPTAPLREPIVLHFRRLLHLENVPGAYPVRVSADNRFILFVNGQRVGDGPARGDLSHWRYERYDLAPFLKAGQNLITAEVWNFGVYAPIAQMSDRTAFLLESDATGSEGISTPEGWQVEVEPGHVPLDRSSVSLKTYMAAGPGEEIDAAHYDWNWNQEPQNSVPERKPGSRIHDHWAIPSGCTACWLNVGSPMRDSIFAGVNHAHSADTTGDNPWGLVEDMLPHMEYREVPAGAVVRVDPAQDPNGALRRFPEQAVTIPAHSHLHLLLDRKTLTTAYPELTVSGGKGSRIQFTYAEALYDKDQHKGDRDAVDDRRALGLVDRFLPDGGDQRTFEPLWWRTWRYLDLDIETTDVPLKLDAMKAWFSAYPFEERAKLKTGDPELDKIWEISWRTARLDAHETYMDTPYYEQLQYIGDTRIQALISYSVADDDWLARQALAAFDDSRMPEGLTRSRYPSSLPQTIPTFSLLWIGMLHDYWMYRPDPEPVRSSLEGMRGVLGWYAEHERPDGLLEKLPWWSFVDWVSSGEIPTYSKNGESCVTTLEYLGALQDAADLEQHLGDSVAGERDRQRAQLVRDGLYRQCWNPERKLIADNPDKDKFSQQANVLAVLYDVVPRDEQKDVLQSMLSIEPGTTPDGVLSASYYFRFYLARALEHAGMADAYLQSLDPWRKLLALHFTTWPEEPGNTRSDSHAWTAHPIYDLLTLVAGIEPASPGFKTVRVAPHLGDLPALEATFPHPLGPIQVRLHRSGQGIEGIVQLPENLAGEFVFRGKSQHLGPGINTIHVD